MLNKKSIKNFMKFVMNRNTKNKRPIKEIIEVNRKIKDTLRLFNKTFSTFFSNNY